jgi:DNA-binding NarL/FixJ family response regulator
LAAIGQPDRALVVLWEAWQACQAAEMISDQAAFGPDLAAFASAAGRPSIASEVAGRLEDLATANPGVASMVGGARRARGLADLDAERLLQALEAYRASPRRYEQARTAEDAALALARVGRRQEAELVAAEALQLYATSRVAWEASRARSALRKVGLHPALRGTRSRSTTGWAALTRTEERVASLVVEGLSNAAVAERLFLSRRTVESHVSHIFGKLGLRSRVALASAWAERETVQQRREDRQ